VGEAKFAAIRYNLTICRLSGNRRYEIGKFAAHLGGGTTTHLTFRTGSGQTSGPGLLEERRGNLKHLFEHVLRQVTNLPLSPSTAAQTEKVTQLSGIHGHYKTGMGGVGQDKASIFGGNPGRP
jgi:hypothetical protein